MDYYFHAFFYSKNMKEAKNKKTYSPLTVGLITFFGLSQVAMAEEKASSPTLSLEQALQEGVQDSPTVKKYESAEHFASANTMLGLSGLLPHFELKAQHDFDAQYETVPVTLGNLTTAVPEVSPRTSLGVSVHWVIFDGLANVKNYQASLNLSNAAQLDLSRILQRARSATFRRSREGKCKDLARKHESSSKSTLKRCCHKI
jgi:hypothetical protein